jgi:DNA-binding IclR family transcriptional regulator
LNRSSAWQRAAFSEISRQLEIPKSSAHVIVVTLERLGYVQRKPDSLNYRLGLKAYGLGRGMMKNPSIADIALPLFGCWWT